MDLFRWSSGGAVLIHPTDRGTVDWGERVHLDHKGAHADSARLMTREAHERRDHLDLHLGPHEPEELRGSKVDHEGHLPHGCASGEAPLELEPRSQSWNVKRAAAEPYSTPRAAGRGVLHIAHKHEWIRHQSTGCRCAPRYWQTLFDSRACGVARSGVRAGPERVAMCEGTRK